MKIKKKVALSGLLLCCAITAKAQVCITPQVEQRARELVSQMTLEEKIDYISGPKSFYIRAVPRLGIYFPNWSVPMEASGSRMACCCSP